MSILNSIKKLVQRKRLSCEDVNHFLMDYLEGTMDDRVRTRYEAHLRHCPNCAQFLDHYQDTISLVHDDGRVELPDELVSRTLDFLQNHYDDEA